MPAGRDLSLVIRPEHLRLGEAGPDENALAGEVRQAVYQGDTVLLILDAGGGLELRVRLQAGRATHPVVARPGERVDLALHRDDTVVLAERPA